MKRKVLSFILAMCFILSTIPLTVSAASSFANLHVVVRPDAVGSAKPGSTLANASQIGLQNAGTTPGAKITGNYLFLPSSADLGALTFIFDAEPGADIRATTTLDPGATPVNVTSGSPADIGSLFGGVTVSDYQYPVTLTDYVNGGDITFTVVKAERIPSMHITTENEDISLINADKSYREAGTMCMVNSDGSLVYNGAMTSIKGRGNTSWDGGGNKKPYNIKLEQKTELVPGAAKNWCLISNNNTDDSLIKYYIALQFALAMNSSGSPGSVGYADVSINGEYRGLYQINEKKEIGSSRVDIHEMEKTNDEGAGNTYTTVTQPGDPAIDAGISEYRYWDTATTTSSDPSGGFLADIDLNYDVDAYTGFVTKKMSEISGFTSGVALTSPEYATKEQVQYLAKLVQDFENALYSPTGYNEDGIYYAEYIDMPSLALYQSDQYGR